MHDRSKLPRLCCQLATSAPAPLGTCPSCVTRPHLQDRGLRRIPSTIDLYPRRCCDGGKEPRHSSDHEDIGTARIKLRRQRRREKEGKQVNPGWGYTSAWRGAARQHSTDDWLAARQTHDHTLPRRSCRCQTSRRFPPPPSPPRCNTNQHARTGHNPDPGGPSHQYSPRRVVEVRPSALREVQGWDLTFENGASISSSTPESRSEPRPKT